MDIPTPAQIDALRTVQDTQIVEQREHELEAQIIAYLQEDYYPVKISLGAVSDKSTTFPIYAGIVKAKLEKAGWKVKESHEGPNWHNEDGNWITIQWLIDKK